MSLSPPKAVHKSGTSSAAKGSIFTKSLTTEGALRRGQGFQSARRDMAVTTMEYLLHSSSSSRSSDWDLFRDTLG